MPKKIYCANCGIELRQFRKAIRSKGIIVDMVEPHSCTEITDPKTLASREVVPVNVPETTRGDINKMFNSFKFVKKLNKLDEKKASGDLRHSESLRKEKETSSAPASLIDQLKQIPSSQIDHTKIDDVGGGD
jgi:hypothetical protein